MRSNDMKIKKADLVSVTDASRQSVSKLVSEASAGRDLILVRNNKSVAAIIGVEKLERLHRIENAELLALTVLRAVTDTGQRVTLEDAAARLGIDLNDLVE